MAADLYHVLQAITIIIKWRVVYRQRRILQYPLGLVRPSITHS
jgi:hypothetical protein